MGLFAEGFQSLIDGQQRYLRSGLEVFLRVQNFAPSGDFQEVGVPYAPSGQASLQAGFTDMLIDPPPEVVPISAHNIGLSNGRLMQGATKFKISGSFILNIREKYPTVLTSYDVYRNWDGSINQTPNTQTASVIGLIYGNWLYSIESIGRKVIGDRSILWELTCNAQELYLKTNTEEPNPHDQQL